MRSKRFAVSEIPKASKISCALTLSTRLIDLVADCASRILKIFLLNCCERSKNDQFEDKVGEGAENNEVVEAGLYLAHFR